MTELRILRKTTKRHNENGSYWHFDDTLQYFVPIVESHMVGGYEWRNVPIVEKDQSNNTEGGK